MRAGVAQADGISLQPAGQWPGMRALAWNGTRLYASRGYTLLCAEPTAAGTAWTEVARFHPSAWRAATSRFRLTYRLCRDGFHGLAPVGGGRMVGIVPGAMVAWRPGEADFRCTHRIRRGTRPLSLATTPAGQVFWGEYFDNRDREEVHIYGSCDGGETWDAVHTFPRGAVRHVHTIAYDRWHDCLWVATGDYGRECRILRASCDWRQVDTVLSGNQQARAVALVPSAAGLYFASDTPLERNCVYRMDAGGRITELSPLNSSCFFGCSVGEAIFFSTAVEPSSVNADRRAAVYGSAGGERFQKLLEWPKDHWSMRFFQYGTAVLPAGDNRSGMLAVTGVALQDNDLDLRLWTVHNSVGGRTQQ